MKPWKVLSKDRKQVDSDSVELHLRVERGGAQRDVIVSGATFYSVEVGGTVDLPTHSGASEEQARHLQDVLHRMLVRTGLDWDASRTTAEIVSKAEEFIASPPVVLVERSTEPVSLQEQLMFVAGRIEAEGVSAGLLDGVADGDEKFQRTKLIALAMLDGAIEETT